MLPEIPKNQSSLPDPWELSNPNPEEKTPENYQIFSDSHPLISPVGDPHALQLPASPANPGKVLLQDWLKLKTQQAREMTEQMQEALGLLYWIGETAS